MLAFLFPGLSYCIVRVPRIINDLSPNSKEDSTVDEALQHPPPTHTSELLFSQSDRINTSLRLSSLTALVHHLMSSPLGGGKTFEVNEVWSCRILDEVRPEVSHQDGSGSAGVGSSGGALDEACDLEDSSVAWGRAMDGLVLDARRGCAGSGLAPRPCAP